MFHSIQQNYSQRQISIYCSDCEKSIWNLKAQQNGRSKTVYNTLKAPIYQTNFLILVWLWPYWQSPYDRPISCFHSFMQQIYIRCFLHANCQKKQQLFHSIRLHYNIYSNETKLTAIWWNLIEKQRIIEALHSSKPDPIQRYLMKFDTTILSKRMQQCPSILFFFFSNVMQYAFNTNLM